ERLAVETGGLLQRLLDAVEGGRLALPAGIVGEPVVGQVPGAPHQREIGLDFAVAALGLLDQAVDGGLVEDLPHRHRPAGGDDLQHRLAALLDLRLGRALPALYLASPVNGGIHGTAFLRKFRRSATCSPCPDYRFPSEVAGTVGLEPKASVGL